MKYDMGIFTKPIHIEKLTAFMGTIEPQIKYFISTDKQDLNAHEFYTGVSYCCPFIVDVEQYYCNNNKTRWYNYHPAPLPKYKGLTCYSFPIKDGVKSFGVTLHKMTNQVDSGDIIDYIHFDLMTEPINSNELGCIAHYYLFQLFKRTIIKLTDDNLKSPK